MEESVERKIVSSSNRVSFMILWAEAKGTYRMEHR